MRFTWKLVAQGTVLRLSLEKWEIALDKCGQADDRAHLSGGSVEYAGKGILCLVAPLRSPGGTRANVR
jgi:hypothetical protein